LNKGDEGSGLYFQPTRSSQKCVYSCEPISEGEYAVSIKDDKYLVWLSIDKIDDIVYDLEQFDPEEARKGCHIVNQYLKFGKSRRETQCGVCNNEMEHREYGITFRNPHNRHRAVWIHTDCVDDFINGLEDVWDYPEHILPGQI